MSRRTRFAVLAVAGLIGLAVVVSATMAADSASIAVSPPNSVSAPLVVTAGDVAGRTVTFSNGDKSKSTKALRATLTGTGFSMAADTCSGTALGPRKSCSVTVTFPGSVPSADQVATVTVGPKSSPPSPVTAHFTVEGAAPTTISVTKDADPADGTDFDFTGDLGAFQLDDGGAVDAVTTTKAFAVADNEIGTKTITETLKGGWTVTAIICTGSSAWTPDLEQQSVDVFVNSGDNVECTFFNRPAS